MSSKIINVGIIGCGQAAQVIHIPTLNFMHEYFNITYLHGVSPSALDFCSKRVVNHVPKTTFNVEELCASADVDVVFVLSSWEFHVEHTCIALKHGKNVFVEKPMAMSILDANRVVEAEKKSKGRVFVGYMRRYATAFVDAVKEVGGMDKILYARVRDIIGPNEVFVDQSATFPKQFSDYNSEAVRRKAELAEEIINMGLGQECKVTHMTQELVNQYLSLGGLGCHDLSAMREALGMPNGVTGVSFEDAFWNVLFKYPTFTVSYESGYYDVPLFDAHIEVYSSQKSVRIQWDTPFIKSLPVTIHIRENVDGALRETTIRKTYEDAFTLQMRELYAMVVEGKPIRTTAEDSIHDLYLYRMIIQAGIKGR